MASLSAKSKKGTVIHRTTSETLRLGDEALNNQVRISATTRKKSQATSPSCSFQITGVMTRYDLEDESADDLDESHTDEISRVTDNETPSFSEDSRDDQHPPVQPPPLQYQPVYNQNIVALSKPASPPEELSPSSPPQVIKEEPKKTKKSNINDLGRFRVVKLGSMVPFSRGRWTCYDYVDESSEGKQSFSNVDNSATSKPYWESSCQPSYLYTGSIILPEPIPIYVPLSTERPISSQHNLPKSRVSFASCNSVDTVINNSSLDTNQNEQSLSNNFNVRPALQHQNALVTAANQETVLNDNTGASVSCTATIDTKIEHALDVVKNHLTHAVRLEVEELKVKINELVERISYLEYENDLLRSNVTADVLANLAGMSVLGFTDIIQGALAQYIQFSQQIGGDVAQHGKLVEQAFKIQLQFLQLASQSSKPANQNDVMVFLKPTSDIIAAIQDFREKNRVSPYFNHLSAISESIPALGWVAVSPTPAPYIKEMNDAGQFYTNRVLKDWKEKDKRHVEWVKAWVQTLTELQAFVKQHHTTGLVWSGKSAPVGVPPPPPSCPLPPPPMGNLAPAGPDAGSERSALFAEINQGANITQNLKKVTSDMQTHKNPTLKQGGSGPFRGTSNTGSGGAAGQPDKPPVFTRDGKKWLIENQVRNHNLVVENPEMNNVVYLYRCVECTVTIRGKINSVVIDACKKTAIVMDSVVAAVEFINCQSVQMQIFGKVPTVSIDKTDGCQVYLSPESLDVEVVSSKSSEMNILIPKGDGDYVEHPVPEQYKTTILPNKTLKTIIVENKG